MNMSKTSNTDDFSEAVAARMYELDNAARGLGIIVDMVRPGHSRARMTVREDMLNSHRICHGGMLFLLADTAFAYACNAENKATVASSCTISFVAGANLGEQLTAIASERHRGGRTGIYDIEVTDRAGDIVALFRGNSYQTKGVSAPGVEGQATRAPGRLP